MLETTPPSVDVAALVVPQPLGDVVARRPIVAALAKTVQTVILVKDAHVNYEAQKHLAQIIDTFATTYGIRLVLVEGSSADASLSDLRSYTTKEKRQAVAEQFLKRGEISGEEYLDLTVDYPLMLWGIESRPLYEAGLHALVDSETIRENALQILRPIHTTLKAFASVDYPKPLLELDHTANEYENGTLSLTACLDRLQQWASETGMTTDTFPHLHAVLMAKAQERQVNLSQVQAEQQAAMRVAKQQLSSAAWQALLEVARQANAGKRSTLSYYRTLAQALESLGQGGMTSYPNLTAYVRHLELMEALDPGALSAELHAFIEEVGTRLATTESAKRLWSLTHHLELLEQLMRLEVTPEEYAELRALLTSSWSTGWLRELRGQGVDEALLRSWGVVVEAVPACVKFYDVANQRSEVFVERIIAKMNETHVPAAIVRLGGFHASQVAQALHDRGLAVAVISPKVSQATDPVQYHQMLKYKAGLISKENLHTETAHTR